MAVLEGIPGHETGDSRLRGFRDGITPSAGITIVASQPANWERDQGFTVFQNMLQAHPDIDAVFACSDLMALGAVEAIAAANRTGKIRVVGFDALDGCAEGDRGGTHGGLGGAVAARDGPAGGGERRQADARRDGPGRAAGADRAGEKVAGRLGDWATGRLGGWATGRLGTGDMGDWATRLRPRRS